MIVITVEIENRIRQDPAALDALILRLALGDTEALSELYQDTKGALYGFVLSILKNTQDAQDALHDCYVSVWAAAGGYRSEGKPMAWMMTIARNLCLQRIRERGRLCDLPAEDWEPFLRSREDISAEDRFLLEQCMKILSDEERQIVVLHAAAGFRHREIAQMMGLALPTVLSKYSRSLKKLKNAYEGGGKQ